MKNIIHYAKLQSGSTESNTSFVNLNSLYQNICFPSTPMDISHWQTVYLQNSRSYIVRFHNKIIFSISHLSPAIFTSGIKRFKGKKGSFRSHLDCCLSATSSGISARLCSSRNNYSHPSFVLA